MESFKEYLRFFPFFVLTVLVVPFDNTPKVIYVIAAFAVTFMLSILKVFDASAIKRYSCNLAFVAFACMSLLWVYGNFSFSATRLQSCALMYLLLLLSVKYCKQSDFAIHGTLLAILIGSVILMYSEFGNIASGMTALLTDADRMNTEALNSNAMGKYFAISAMICLYFTYSKRKLIFVPIFFAFAFCILMLKSKSATLSLVLGTIVFSYLFCARINNKKYFWIGLCVIVAVFIYLERKGVWGDTFIRMNRMFDFFFKGDSSDQSTADRAYLAEKSLELFWQHPIGGWGIGSANSLLGSYSHNNYAQLLMETGIIGFLLFYIPIFGIIKSLYRFRSDDLCLLMMAILAIFLLSDFNNTTYYHKIYYIVIGLSSSLAYRKLNSN